MKKLLSLIIVNLMPRVDYINFCAEHSRYTFLSLKNTATGEALVH